MEHTWAVLAGLFFAPFVQEDAAVFGAAGAAAMNLAPDWAVFAAALLGLTASDTWKYWAGRFAARHDWARRIAGKPAAAALKDRICQHLAATMFAARFVPGTRVPLYLAAGAFEAPFAAFFAYVVLSGALYLGIAFALVRLLGAVAGEAAAGWLPLGVAGLALAYFTWLLARRAIARARAAEG